jgi:hypothetical protein
MDPYVPTDSPRSLLWLERAAAHNASLDSIDHANGNATPAAAGLSALLRTAVTAVLCGHARDSWDEVGQGLVLVIQAEHLARQLEEKMDIRVKDGPGTGKGGPRR